MAFWLYYYVFQGEKVGGVFSPLICYVPLCNVSQKCEKQCWGERNEGESIFSLSIILTCYKSRHVNTVIATWKFIHHATIYS